MAKTPSKPTSTSKRKAATAKSAAAKAPARSQTVAATKVKTPVTKARKTAARAKTAAPKVARAKASRSKTVPVKAAKVSLQSQLDTVSKRLIAADKKTKKNIAALEADFSALAAQMDRTKAGQTQLTRRVTILSNTLTKDLENLQSGVKQDLTQALHNPTLDGLQAALSRAERRLSESETAQDTAIMRINRHIADIATIVEARLSDEALAREAAMAEMKRVISAEQSQMMASQSKIEKTQSMQYKSMQLRFSNLQSESADAIRSIGDKVVDVAEEMGRRREMIAAQIRQELSEATLSSSAEFEQFRRVVERRLEALETDVRDVEGYVDRAITPLSSRIEGLEYGLTRAPAPQQDYAPSLQAVPPMTAAQDYNHAQTSPQQGNSQDYAEDAFSPAEASYDEAAAIAQPAPTIQAQVQAQDEAAEKNSAQQNPEQAPLELDTPAAAQAVPYDPSAYAASQYPSPQSAPPSAHPYTQNIYAQNAYVPPYAQAPDPRDALHAQDAPQNYTGQPSYLEPPYAGQAYPAQQAYPEQTGYPEQTPYTDQAQPPQSYAAVQPPFPKAEDLAVIDGDLPYADPAYAETQAANGGYSDDSMGAARPGAFESLKKIGRKSSAPSGDGGSAGRPAFITPRNIKLGGLVAALGLVGFIGAQTLAGKNQGPQNNEFSVASNAALDESRPSLASAGGAMDQILSPNATAQSGGMTPNVDQETIGQYADNRKMALAAGGEDQLSAAAKAGNPAAQLQLGLETIEKGDLEEGVALIRAAANQEQPAALYRLAKLYETGQGVGQDSKTARQLTERAARGGNRIAMHDLALYYAEEGGRGGVEMDMPTAASWFEKAAQRGVVDSQYNLGILYESGQGLPQDLESALVWYSIAGAQGDQMAASRVSVLRKTLGEDKIARADTRIAAFTPARIDEEANGIFTNVPWAKPAKVANNGAEKSTIIQTQTLLNTLGYAVGTADGAIGPKTKNAILNFQRNNGLTETGTVNSELIERLEMAAGA